MRAKSDFAANRCRWIGARRPGSTCLTASRLGPTALFARYSLTGALSAASGALAAAVPDVLTGLGFDRLAAPLVACGTLKITYDLALLFAFRNYKGHES